MIVLTVVLALNSTPAPADTSVKTDIMCETTRAYVREFGEKAAREYAQRHGWSKERVAEAEKCLHR